MKSDMVEYLNVLSGDDLEKLETIISRQFKKFRQFYWLIREYSDDIKTLEYEFKSDQQLYVTILFKNSDMNKKVKPLLEENISENSYDGFVCISKNKLEVSLTLDETTASK